MHAMCLSMLMERTCARMIFTDPPYNVRVNGHVCGLGKIRHDELAMASGEISEAEFAPLLSDVMVQLVDASADGSIHFILCMDWRHLKEMLLASEGYIPS